VAFRLADESSDGEDDEDDGPGRRRKGKKDKGPRRKGGGGAAKAKLIECVVCSKTFKVSVFSIECCLGQGRGRGEGFIIRNLRQGPPSPTHC
jgi:hypothetical protein